MFMLDSPLPVSPLPPSEPIGSYVAAARSLDHAGLLSLWEAVMRHDTPGFPPGRALEHLILRAFELDGAEVTWPYTVRLGEDEHDTEQIDGAVVLDGLFAIVEVKDGERINVEPIAKLRSQLQHRPGLTLGLMYSRSGYTGAARTLARFMAPQTILLWDGDDIATSLRRGTMKDGLRRKLRHAVEHGIPDYNLERGEPGL